MFIVILVWAVLRVIPSMVIWIAAQRVSVEVALAPNVLWTTTVLVRREASFTGGLDGQVLKVLLGQLLVLIQALLHFLCALLVSFIKVFFVFFKQLFVPILCQMRRLHCLIVQCANNKKQKN